MRNKKSKTILYVIAVVLILGFIFVATRDFTPSTEVVEQSIENDFSRR